MKLVKEVNFQFLDEIMGITKRFSGSPLKEIIRKAKSHISHFDTKLKDFKIREAIYI